MQIIMFISSGCWLTTQDFHTLFVFFDYVVRTRSALARSSRWIISLSMWMMINVTSFYIATDSFLWSDLWDLKCSAAAAEFDSVSAVRQKIIFFHVCMKFNWADKISFSSSNNFWIADKRATFCGRPARHSKYIFNDDVELRANVLSLFEQNFHFLIFTNSALDLKHTDRCYRWLNACMRKKSVVVKLHTCTTKKWDISARDNFSWIYIFPDRRTQCVSQIF